MNEPALGIGVEAQLVGANPDGAGTICIERPYYLPGEERHRCGRTARRYPADAAIGAYPDVSLLVFSQSPDAVLRQFRILFNFHEASAIELVKSLVGTDHEITLP